MSLLGDASTVRKLGNLVAAVFPGLDRVWSAAESHVRARASSGWPARAWTRFRTTRAGEIIASVVDRFYWGSYRQDRVEWTSLPAEGAALLRAGYVIALLLCVSIPLAASPWGRSVLLPGDQGRLAWWSAALLVVSLAAGRALLLAGAASSNRLMLCFAALLDLYVGFGLATCGEAKRSWLGLLTATPALLAVFGSERALSRPGYKDRASSGLAALIVGGAAGAVCGMLLPPLAGLGPIKIIAGAAAGVVSACAVGWLGRRKAAPGAGATRLAGWLLWIELAASGVAVVRFGAGKAVGADVDLANLVSGFLWPLWYFAGVGIIFKLLGSAKTLAKAVREVLPGRRLTVFTLAALLLATLLLWLPSLLDAPQHGIPGWLMKAAAWAYVLGRKAIWLQVDRAMAAETVRWIVLGELVWAIVQVARRRFDTSQAFTLLLVALLGTIGAYEYVVQQLGFLRSGPHTVVALTGFGIWLLWMLQKSGQKIGVGSSPRWPATARLALFGAVLVLVLAQVHARSARLDPAFSNEVFLLLYKAFIDVGIPYAIFVWAGKGLPAMPASTSALLIAFCTGALLTLPMHALGRLDACGWSLARLSTVLTERGESLLQGNMEPLFTDPSATWGWIAARGAALLAAAGVAGAWLQKRRGQAAAMTILLAASAGLGSFSRAMLDVPVLSPRMIALTAPARQTFELDAHVVASYLVWSLPILVVVWMAARIPGRLQWLIGALAGLGVHVIAARLWPGEDAWLRSSGVMWTLGAMGTVWIVALGAWARGVTDPQAPRSSGLRAAGLVAAATCTLLALAGWQAWRGRAVDRELLGLDAPLRVPAWWEPATAPQGVGAAFKRSAAGPIRSTMLASAVDRQPAGPQEALVGALAPLQEGLPAFELSKPDHGGAVVVVPGAVTVGFTFETTLPDGTTVPVAGSALARDIGERTLVLLWMGPVGDRDRQRWDLARIAGQLSR